MVVGAQAQAIDARVAVLVDQVAHLVRELPALDEQARLGVRPGRARVEVHRADEQPRAVDHRHLGVQPAKAEAEGSEQADLATERRTDLVELDAVPRDLVGVRGADALPGRAELAAAALAFVEAVECDVPRHEQVSPFRDAQVRRRDPALLERRDLLDEEREVDDRPGAEHADRVRVEDAGRDEVQLEGALFVDDGVSGVVAALVADDEIRLLREEVRDLAFALVAPLRSDDGGHRHVTEC